MCLIKTAIISGAAMYGVNKLAKTAQAHQSNTGYAPSPPRRRSDEHRDVDYFDHETESYRDHSHGQTQGRRQRGSQHDASQDYWEPLSWNNPADPYDSPRRTRSRYLEGDSTEHPDVDNSASHGQDWRQYQYVPRAPSAPPSYDLYSSSRRYFSEPQKVQTENTQVSRRRSP
jgi:hypothetical protein